jgi:plasmid stabilization system protein ParE
MTDGRIPEGRKPLTDADIAALTRRLAGTAVDYKELYEAAKRDAEEAEAYAAELEAKLAKAVDVLEAALKYNTAMHGGAAAYNQRIKDAIAELKGGKHE